MENNNSDNFFIEIFYPELVDDVRKIFKDHIFPHAEPRDKPGKNLRYLIIDDRQEHESLNALLEKYIFLSEYLLIFNLHPQIITDIHTDGIVDDATNTSNLRGWKRQYSLNIPIKNCTDQCKTEFFTVKKESMFVDEHTNTTWLKAGESAEKIAEYCLKNNPILMNPQIPHKITNFSQSIHRISVSWTIKPGWSWEQLLKHFRQRQKTHHINTSR